MLRLCTILLALYFLVPFSVPAQQADIRTLVETGAPWEKWGIRDTAAIREFYRTMEYRAAWTGNEGRAHLPYLLTLLKQAADQGLEEKDYQYDFIRSFRDSILNLQYNVDWIMHEFRLADAALHYFRDIAFGNTVPAFGYAGLNYKPECISVPWQLARHIHYNSLEKLSQVLEPPIPEIKVIRSGILRLRKVLSDTAFREEKIVSLKSNAANKPLLKKLYYLGIHDSLDGKFTDKMVVAKVREVQKLFDLLDDGVIRSTLLKELNISIPARLKQLNLSLNYYRWLYCLSRKESVVVVNIPAAYLKVYSEGKPELEMRMIVGKPSTPTPTLTSRITQVILYPYWMVPYKIATKELLPSIKRNPGYIDAHSYQVLNQQGKVVNPYSINWHALSTSYFPYVIRQSTGCDNALGLLKLNFYNPYSVYLHDTPSKSLFMLNKRYFSHGCMRMEKPLDLGHMVMRNNEVAIDTLTEKGCLHNQSPLTVHAEVHMPVVVWYNPAGVNPAGKLVYFGDAYRKFQK